MRISDLIFDRSIVYTEYTVYTVYSVECMYTRQDGQVKIRIERKEMKDKYQTNLVDGRGGQSDKYFRHIQSAS